MRLNGLASLGVASTAVACPCHVISGAMLGALAALGGTAPALSPELQDAFHGVYLPIAVIVAALLAKRGTRNVATQQAHTAQPPDSSVLAAR